MLERLISLKSPNTGFKNTGCKTFSDKKTITRYKELLEDKLQMASPPDSKNIIFHQIGVLQDTGFEVTFFLIRVQVLITYKILTNIL